MKGKTTTVNGEVVIRTRHFPTGSASSGGFGGAANLHQPLSGKWCLITQIEEAQDIACLILAEKLRSEATSSGTVALCAGRVG